jgi:hypothetical protein
MIAGCATTTRIGRVWLATDGPAISLDAVERIEPSVQADLDEQFYALRFNRLTPREVAYALAIAELGDGPQAVLTERYDACHPDTLTDETSAPPARRS